MGAYADHARDLIKNGFAPIPIKPGTKKPGFLRAGVYIGLSNWQSRFNSGVPSDEVLAEWAAGDTGIGILTGPPSHGAVGVDIDTDDPAIVAAIVGVLPETFTGKRGTKGETLFYYGPAIAVSKRWRIDGKTIVELLGPGRQTVLPPTLHEDTGLPYEWTRLFALKDVAPADLPLLGADIVEAITAALVPFGYKVEQPLLAGGNGFDDPSPHRELNEVALANLAAWVPDLDLYHCCQARGGYEAVPIWRPSTTGRALEQRHRNLKISPRGIRDFGVDEGYTPLDLVMTALGCKLEEAFVFLSDRLGFADGVEIRLETGSKEAPSPLLLKPATGKTVFELRHGHAAAEPQPMGTIVKGILHAGSVTLIYGPPKSGKSLLLTDLFLKLTLPDAKDWMGHAILRHGPVLYGACEGHAGFWKRLRAVEIDYGILLPDDFVLAIGRPHLIKIDPRSHALVPHPDDVIDAVKRATLAGHAPIAVAIDTVFRSVGCGNVNASDHMNAYLAALAVVTDQGIAVAIVHHETKGGGTPAGSVTLIGGCDTLVNTQRLDIGGHSWRVEMAKDDCETRERLFELETVDVGRDLDGQAQTSCVVRDGKTAAKPKKKLSREQETAYKALLESLEKVGSLNAVIPCCLPVVSISRNQAREYLLRYGFFHEGHVDADGKFLKPSHLKLHNMLRDLKNKDYIDFNEEFVWQP
jgi:hypothetical protein